MTQEDLLFEVFKDTKKLSSDCKRFKVQLKFPKVDMSSLHRRIVNYQVKKYGQSLR